MPVSEMNWVANRLLKCGTATFGNSVCNVFLMSDLPCITEGFLGGKECFLSHKVAPLPFFVCLFSSCSDSRLVVYEFFQPFNFLGSYHVLTFPGKILKLFVYYFDDCLFSMYSDLIYKITSYICRCFTGCCLDCQK